MYESILVPTDGSDAAERAVGHAFGLAEAFDATVHVLGVADIEGKAGPFDVGGVPEEFVERVEAESESDVKSVADMAGERRVETAVVKGSPASAILDYATDAGVDLVAMGTHGRTGISRLLTGSTSAQVVRRSPVPVLTARLTDDDSATDDEATDDGSTDYGDVLLPTDGSPASDVAVDHAIAIADAFDATVHVVYVVDVNAVAGGMDATSTGVSAGGLGTADLLDPLLSVGEEATDDVAERVRDAGLDAETQVIEGSPGSSLLDYIDEKSIDLVTMGTHGRSGLDRVLLGSTTERLVRRSPVPVVSVRAETDDPLA